LNRSGEEVETNSIAIKRQHSRHQRNGILSRRSSLVLSEITELLVRRRVSIEVPCVYFCQLFVDETCDRTRDSFRWRARDRRQKIEHLYQSVRTEEGQSTPNRGDYSSSKQTHSIEAPCSQSSLTP
jgi:predicted Fe-S protein YdhL (DUF1289 family)